jgi:O-antigen/teichoic acid export membrane protein
MAKSRRNSLALMGESIARMGAGFVVAILIAREYGPDGLGLITTASASVTIFLGFSALGLSGVLVRELVEKVELRGTIMLTVTLAKLAAGALLLGGLIFATNAFGEDPSLTNLTLIMGLGYLFASLDTVDCLYNAREEFTRLVALRMTALGISTVMKLIAIEAGWGLGYVALGYALDYGLVYLIPAIDFIVRKRNGLRSGAFPMRVDLGELGRLIRRSWPILVSGGFAQINLRIDTLMIAGMVSIANVGIYSAATRLSESWSVLAMAIVTALFPALVKLARTDVKAYGRELSQLLRWLIWLSGAGAIVIAVLAPMIIQIVYGPEFAAAAGVLTIHIFGGIFLFVRTAVSRWLIIENLFTFSLVSHAMGAAVNIALNFALIPTMGITGAAWSSVASYATSGILFLLVSRRARPMFFMIMWSALPKRWSTSAVERLAMTMSERRKA